jgi:hypothetical protein
MKMFSYNEENNKLEKMVIRLFIIIGLLIITFVFVFPYIGFIRKTSMLNNNNTSNKKKRIYQSSCKFVPFMNIVKNPIRNIDKRVKFTGQVMQIIDNETKMIFTVKVDNNFSKQGDIIYVNYKKSKSDDLILKDHLISLWGECIGLTTYAPINSNKITVPRIDAKYIETYIH